jgi:hypothetical protein
MPIPVVYQEHAGERSAGLACIVTVWQPGDNFGMISAGRILIHQKPGKPIERISLIPAEVAA